MTDAGSAIEADHVMLATGRKPNTKNLGLEDVGVETDAGGVIKVRSRTFRTHHWRRAAPTRRARPPAVVAVLMMVMVRARFVSGPRPDAQVDEYSQTSVPSVYAIGDVTDRINLTPVALHEGMMLARTLFGGDPTKADHENVASAVFCNPEVASVGLTEEAARERFANVDVYASTFRPMKNTISGSPLKMMMKLVVDHDSDRVVGAHVVGPAAGEMMQGIGIAVKMGATKRDFDSTIGIHPTAAEEIVTMRTVTREHRKEMATA